MTVTPSGGRPRLGYAVGSALLWLLARLVPAIRRARWLEEWRGELWHHGIARRSRHGPRGMGLSRRLAGALPDAWSTRRLSTRSRWSARPALVESTVMDLRLALRGARKRPGFTALAVLTLAMGIGVTTSTFSVVKQLLRTPLPGVDPEGLVKVWEQRPSQGRDRNVASYPDFLDWRDQHAGFTEMAAYRQATAALTGVDRPEQIAGARVTHGFFDVLQVAPMLGRRFTAADDSPDATPVVILSHGLWRQRLDADRRVLGRTLRLDGRDAVVIGVMPASFDFPFGVEYWVPLAVDPATANRGSHGFDVIARLRSGVSVQDANRDLDVIAKRLEAAYPGPNTGHYARAFLMRDELLGPVIPGTVVLSGAVAFVLLIACANVANMLLARGAGRAREIAVRAAMGASRARVMRQLFTESMVLAALGGVAGIAWAMWRFAAIERLVAPSVPWIDSLALDPVTVLFVIGTSLVTAVVFGLAPALHVAHGPLTAGLRDGGDRHTANPTRSGLRNVLVVAQVALALVLLIGTGLLSRSLIALVDVDPGFDPQGVVVADLALPNVPYDDEPIRRRFFDALRARVDGVPGLETTGLTWILPLTGRDAGANFLIDGRPDPEQADDVNARYRIVDAGYFETMRIPLQRGRMFGRGDTPTSPSVALVNQAAAQRYWPNGDAVGARIRFDDDRPWTEVVGVVADVRHQRLSVPPNEELYLLIDQMTPPAATLVARTTGDPTAFFDEIRAAVAAVDADLPIARLTTMVDVVTRSVGPAQAVATVMGVFGGIAIALAAIGIYGVVSYSVSQRTHEIGVRLALGGATGQVRGMVLRQGMKPVGIGILIGLFAALLLSRTLAGLLFGVTATDVPTYGVALAVFVSVALAACYLPARRATRVDPLDSLRAE